MIILGSVMVLTMGIMLFVALNIPKDNHKITIKVSTHNPTIEEILAQNPNADAFVFGNIVYKGGINWVNELNLTKGKHLGEIQVHNKATKLLIGAEVYEPIENHGLILIVKINEEELRYLGLVEG